MIHKIHKVKNNEIKINIMKIKKKDKRDKDKDRNDICRHLSSILMFNINSKVSLSLLFCYMY